MDFISLSTLGSAQFLTKACLHNICVLCNTQTLAYCLYFTLLFAYTSFFIEFLQLDRKFQYGRYYYIPTEDYLLFNYLLCKLYKIRTYSGNESVFCKVYMHRMWILFYFYLVLEEFSKYFNPCRPSRR